MTFLTTSLSMFLLQVDVTDLWSREQNPVEGIVFVIILVVLVVAIIVVSGSRKPMPGKPGQSAAVTGLFYRMTISRIGRNIGLHHEQIKMLVFVFRTDQVTDPQKSINTPELLDRHFRRAYRVIEQTSKTEEEKHNRLSVLFSTRNILESNVSGGLTSTRQLKDDIRILLTIGKDRYDLPILSASGEHLAVECPKNALGSLIKFQRGSRVSIMLFTRSNKGFACESRIIGHSTVHGQNAVLLAHSNQLRFLSKRRFRRRQTVIATNLFLVYIEGSGRKKRLVVDKRRLTGSIADVSVGGCSIKIKAPIQVGSRLKIEFNQGDSSVAALGLVLRTNRTGMVSVIHVKFLRVTKKSMNTINAFVYDYVSD